jgi:hypothetical protein
MIDATRGSRKVPPSLLHARCVKDSSIMRLCRGYILFTLLTTLSLPNKAAEETRATIIDTGSTNRPGLQITLDASGNAKVESHGMGPHAMRLNSRLCKEFISTIQSTAPLRALPAAHCMKSISFGSSLFIEYNGERTPDLNCPVQRDPKVDALKKQALDILKIAKARSTMQKRQ